MHLFFLVMDSEQVSYDNRKRIDGIAGRAIWEPHKWRTDEDRVEIEDRAEMDRR